MAAKTQTPDAKSLAMKEPGAAALRRELSERQKEAEDLEARARELATSDPRASVAADTRAQATRRLIPRLQEALNAAVRKDKDARIAAAEAEIDAKVRESIEATSKSFALFERSMEAFFQHYNLVAQSERFPQFVAFAENALSIPSMRQIYASFNRFGYAGRIREKEIILQRAAAEKARRRYEIDNEPAGN